MGILSILYSVFPVNSSKIEEKDIVNDSFFYHKFLNIKFKPDYKKTIDR